MLRPRPGQISSIRAGLCGAACPLRTWAVEIIYGGAESGPGGRGAAALDGQGQVVRPRQVRRALPSCEDPHSHVSRVFFSCWRRCINEPVILDVVDVGWCPEGGKRGRECTRNWVWEAACVSNGSAGCPTLSNVCHVTLWCCRPRIQVEVLSSHAGPAHCGRCESQPVSLGAGRWAIANPCGFFAALGRSLILASLGSTSAASSRGASPRNQ